MTTVNRIADLSMLWKQAALVFPYFDRCRIDWNAAYKEYLSKVIAAGNETEFHLLLAEFLNLLEDGHTDYSFPKQLLTDAGHLPFSLLKLDEHYYLREIEESAQNLLLTEVRGINGKAMSDMMAEVYRYLYHSGGHVSMLRLQQLLPLLLKSGGNVLETSKGAYTFDLCRTKPRVVGVPPLKIHHPSRQISGTKLDMRHYDGILYVRLNDFLYSGAAKEIEAALQDDLRGVILDLRENVGGMTHFGARVAELFISGKFSGCQKWTRTMTGVDAASASQFADMQEETIAKYVKEGLCDQKAVEQSRKINANVYVETYTDSFGAADHKALYNGPCALLTSERTVSAAEDFVAMFRSNRRAIVIGTETFGSTGTPMMVPLSCGGRGRICSVGYRLADGTEFIGRGIQPDIEQRQTIEAMATGQDLALERAVKLIAGIKKF